jgi:palmitoyltransferase
MPTNRSRTAPNRSEYDEPPLFCCCEFIDRHGERAHLMDCSAGDGALNALCCCEADGSKSREHLLADLDDRIRLPSYGGAAHVGCEGALPVILLPALAALAVRSPAHALIAAAIVPPAVLLLHVRAVRARRRSAFFPGWTGATFALGNLTFTLVVGEHIWFGYWVASAALQLAAAACASATRRPLAGAAAAAAYHHEASERAVGTRLVEAPSAADGTADEATDEAAEDDEEEGGEGARDDDVDPSTRVVRCGLCGVWTVGYDHHCIWLDACIGAHNLGVFFRGVSALTAALTVQGYVCASRALQRGVWGIEAVLALYALVLVCGLLLLLATVVLNLARGLTAYEVRRRRRQGRPLPAPSCTKLAAGLVRLCA